MPVVNAGGTITSAKTGPSPLETGVCDSFAATFSLSLQLTAASEDASDARVLPLPGGNNLPVEGGEQLPDVAGEVPDLTPGDRLVELLSAISPLPDELEVRHSAVLVPTVRNAEGGALLPPLAPPSPSARSQPPSSHSATAQPGSGLRQPITAPVEPAPRPQSGAQVQSDTPLPAGLVANASEPAPGAARFVASEWQPSVKEEPSKHYADQGRAWKTDTIRPAPSHREQCRDLAEFRQEPGAERGGSRRSGDRRSNR